MHFCPRCKSLLKPDKGILRCDCGYTKKEKAQNISIEKLPKPKNIEIIDEAKDSTGGSTIPITCWKCGHKGAYMWLVQMRRADEAPTKFFRCEKCKNVWRSNS